jgi:hypothetical protein
MGLVFYGNPNRSLSIHKRFSIHQTVIGKGDVKEPTCISSRCVKKLTPENLLFLQNIGIFKNRK